MSTTETQIDYIQKRGHYLHFRTQHGQSYGSVRRCCQVCGVMIWPEQQGDKTPQWTDDPAEYVEATNRCSLRPIEEL